MALSSQSLSPCAASFPLPSPSSAAKATNLPLLPPSKHKSIISHYNPITSPPVSSLSRKWRTRVSFFQGFLTKPKDATPVKEELLQAIQPLDRGAEASPDDQLTIDQVLCSFLWFLVGQLLPLNLTSVSFETGSSYNICVDSSETWSFESNQRASQIRLIEWEMGAHLHYFKIHFANWG